VGNFGVVDLFLVPRASLFGGGNLDPGFWMWGRIGGE